MRALPFAIVGSSLLVASLATATTPYPGNFSLPSGLQLVGTTGGVADPHGQAVVVVRDQTNQPLPNSVVELVFNDCYADGDQDLWLAAQQPFPGMLLNCAPGGPKVVAAVTNPAGEAVFRIVGRAYALPGSPGITTPCVTVRADGVILGTLTIGAYDLNGSGGVNVADVSLFLDVLFRSTYRARADYNNSQTITAADLSRLLRVMLDDGSTESVPADCLD